MTNMNTWNCTGLNVTAILCTCNRAATLAAALKSLAVSQLPESVTWEVLVVDNDSSDRTREIVEDFCRRYPGRFRYLLERNPGKSYALNAGIANARGNILAFVDDDVTVEPNWLQNLTAELHDGEWSGVAGRILPAQTFTPPSWLSWKNYGGAFRPDPLGVLCAHFDLGDQPRALGLNHLPYGANMAFRKSVFERYGGFRLDLGPRPKSQIRNEDVEFGRRLIQAGERLRYEPSAVVYHPVPEGRITKRFFLSWWFDYGRASIRERGDRPNVWLLPYDYLSLLRRITAIPIVSLRWILATRSHKRFFYKCMVWREAGMTAELYRRLLPAKARNSVVV
jgi:glycosyltransferase involved in cell wall biosynthesis